MILVNHIFNMSYVDVSWDFPIPFPQPAAPVVILPNLRLLYPISSSQFIMPAVSSSKLRSVMDEICHSSLQAVEPEAAVNRFLEREDDLLKVAGRTYSLASRRVFLVGTGKAGVPMARAVEAALGDKLQGGLIVVKYSYGGALKKTRVLEAAHPEPDLEGVEAARQIVDFLDKELSQDDLLFVLVSGGGSALLPAPVDEISFEDKRITSSLLLRCGATIQEFNAIRKHLSKVKGGRLLNYTHDADVVALLLSDVVGDDLASIASGPTSADPTTFDQCLEIIDKYEIRKELPGSVIDYITAGATGSGSAQETPKPGDPRFAKVQNVVAGSNIMALQAAAQRARSLGFSPIILSSSITGNTADAAATHVAIAREVLNSGCPAPPPCCIISGGETTLRVTGTGKGGRNQEFVLWCAREIADWPEKDLLFASLGTDGTDGPTDAAGAVASPQTAGRARSKGLSIRDHLERNDSYHFFKELDDLIITGPTQTNVMDLRAILIGQPSRD